MHDFLQRIDPELQGMLGSWAITFDKVQAQIVFRAKLDRAFFLFPPPNAPKNNKCFAGWRVQGDHPYPENPDNPENP